MPSAEADLTRVALDEKAPGSIIALRLLGDEGGSEPEDSAFRPDSPESRLKVGDHDYRAFVGPPDQYDLMGATQFSLLYALGLRSDHRLLDIGCGSLRAGRLFIAYLRPGGYAGLEPNKWLVDEAIEKELGRDVLDLKTPTFVHNEQFDISGLGVFDFIVAQSIASHTGPSMTRRLLRSIREGLTPSGTAVVTFMHSRRVDNATEGWSYPDCVLYRRKTIDSWIRGAGLKGVPIAWFHPRQSWWLIVPEGAEIPPRLFRGAVSGETLAMPRSWNALVRARRSGKRLKTSMFGLLPARTRRSTVTVQSAISGVGGLDRHSH
jgi:SAM-dependent methyltransferase